jgi:ACS family hexuronate transporter-like MFS transporter
VLNYLDRQVLSLTADRLIEEYGLSREQFGSVLAWFRYSYALVQAGGGWLVDVAGARLLYPSAVGLWSVAGTATAFAGSIGALSACRFALGVGEAFNWPCALKVTRKLVPPENRPLANGIFNSGTALGAILAPVVVTVLTLRFGWRASFLVTGALGGIWVLAWLIGTRGKAAQLRGGDMTVAQVPASMLHVMKDRRFWLLGVSAVLVNSVSYFLADWIPLYLKTERGFGFAAGNLLSMLVYAGMDAGSLGAGLAVRILVRRAVSLDAARKYTLLASCACMSFAAAAGVLPHAGALACLVLTGVGVAGFLVIYLTLVQELAPGHVGVSAGLLGGFGNLAYGLMAPYIGRYSDMQQTGVTFLLIATLPWIAFGAIAACRWDEK